MRKKITLLLILTIAIIVISAPPMDLPVINLPEEPSEEEKQMMEQLKNSPEEGNQIIPDQTTRTDMGNTLSNVLIEPSSNPELYAGGKVKLYDEKRQIYIYSIQGKAQYPDEILDYFHDNPNEKIHVMEEFKLHDALTSLIILPEQIEPGKEYIFDICAGSLFNPENGILKSLTPFGKTLSYME